MSIRKLLIANRGEIAIRVARAAAELGIATVAVHAADDAASLHMRIADEAHVLEAAGPAAYLDIEALVGIATRTGCDAVHPGYGFLSENAAFAAALEKAGITFIGPPPPVLALFGDKAAARALAKRCEVPLLEGIPGAASLDEIAAFFAALPEGSAMMIKAVAGGGGRGMRIVERAQDIAGAYERCRSEARRAFGQDAVYAERFLPAARHIEVQVVGDRAGDLVALGERECTIQARHQKLIEFAPSPALDAPLREAIVAAALRLAREAKARSLLTVEFLVDAGGEGRAASYAFIEANPRLQVEHTVTEEFFGVDLVRAQIEIAAGRRLAEVGLADPTPTHGPGFALQARISLGGAESERLTAYDMPSGPGIRVDGCGYVGAPAATAFDPLIAKLVVRSRDPAFAAVAAKAMRALSECRIAGAETNIALLQAILSNEDFVAGRIDTRFLDRHGAVLAGAPAPPSRFFAAPAPAASEPEPSAREADAPAGTVAVAAPLQGTIVSIDVGIGDAVTAGRQIAVLESMKMEHLVEAAESGVVRALPAGVGETLMKGAPIAFIKPGETVDAVAEDATEIDLDAIRPDLAALRERIAVGLDAARPAAVARRRKTGQRTARENVDDLVDPGSFMEYGGLMIAAQRRRRALDDLIANTPADGVVAGIGSVNGAVFPPEAARCMVVAYDYTVLAGTQGFANHKKQDRLFQLAERWSLPLVVFAEGGGGRPGDTDHFGMTGLDVPTFAQFAKLGGLVPLVGIVSGYCFAGNAALLGCCHVIIATRNASIGMGGPAMIEGGGLGVYAAQDVGPTSVQAPNGVIDILVEDEAAACAAAKTYLSYFQGAVATWACADQRHLRNAIPENRLRVYDIRTVIDLVADTGSVLELREKFGIGIVTAFVRIEGRPFGLIANNPRHLGGAIDAEAADKATRFMQLCDAFALPLVSLCDTPGFMVGPQAEATALVRHVCRMFVTGAALRVPFFTIVLRKGYGLGAQSMAAGGFQRPVFTIAWPTGEFGGMGLEGAVRLGFRKELEAITEPAERQAAFETMVAKAYEDGKATNIASVLEIDEVIDPADTRARIMRGLASMPPVERGAGRRGFVDTW